MRGSRGGGGVWEAERWRRRGSGRGGCGDGGLGRENGRVCCLGLWKIVGRESGRVCYLGLWKISCRVTARSSVLPNRRDVCPWCGRESDLGPWSDVCLESGPSPSPCLYFFVEACLLTCPYFLIVPYPSIDAYPLMSRSCAAYGPCPTGGLIALPEKPRAAFDMALATPRGRVQLALELELELEMDRLTGPSAYGPSPTPLPWSECSFLWVQASREPQLFLGDVAAEAAMRHDHSVPYPVGPSYPMGDAAVPPVQLDWPFPVGASV